MFILNLVRKNIILSSEITYTTQFALGGDWLRFVRRSIAVCAVGRVGPHSLTDVSAQLRRYATTRNTAAYLGLATSTGHAGLS